MDDRTRLAGVLRELGAMGMTELFLDEMTATEALAALRDAPERSGRDSRPEAGAVGSAGAATRTPDPVAGPGTVAAPDRARLHGPLQVLAADASTCVACGLSAGRTQVVFGRGNPDAEVVVVGEAPGAEEDRRGEPFVGPAGRLLDLLLLAAGFPRDAVYICNVLKCRPPNNRDPQPNEVATCAPWLHRQLETIQPRVLLAVGKFAAQMLSGTDASISRLRGVVHSYREIPVVATYHPAYLLRSPHATRGTWQDFQLMRRVLDEHD